MIGRQYNNAPSHCQSSWSVFMLMLKYHDWERQCYAPPPWHVDEQSTRPYSRLKSLTATGRILVAGGKRSSLLLLLSGFIYRIKCSSLVSLTEHRWINETIAKKSRSSFYWPNNWSWALPFRHWTTLPETTSPTTTTESRMILPITLRLISFGQKAKSIASLKKRITLKSTAF